MFLFKVSLLGLIQLNSRRCLVRRRSWKRVKIKCGSLLWMSNRAINFWQPSAFSLGFAIKFSIVLAFRRTESVMACCDWEPSKSANFANPSLRADQVQDRLQRKGAVLLQLIFYIPQDTPTLYSGINLRKITLFRFISRFCLFERVQEYDRWNCSMRNYTTREYLAIFKFKFLRNYSELNNEFNVT